MTSNEADNSSEIEDATGRTKNPQPWTPHTTKSDRVGSIFSSPGVKFILIGIITVALLIPAMLVWALVEERADRAQEVAQSISQGWGDRQTINGPYLVVPYRKSELVNGSLNRVTRYAVISPERLEIDGDIKVEERKKSIYKSQLYHMKTSMKGSFPIADLDQVMSDGGVLQKDNAFIVIGVSDTTGFRADARAIIDGSGEQFFEPGLQGLGNIEPRAKTRYRSHARGDRSGGIHLPVDANKLDSGFQFAINLALNGSGDISMVPAGKTTKFALASNWPHPGFDGRFLPETRNLDETGFTASWTIPNLARGIQDIVLSSQLPSADTMMRVNFVEPLKFYQVTARTLKYSIGFFSLVFLAVFIMELSWNRILHWIQYILSGLAMIVFYILLLALAEQIGFDLAYLISSIATTGLIAWYVGDALGRQTGFWIVGAVLGTTYLVMYLILNEEQYALLAGSMIAFLAIAATMIATRKVDWSGAAKEKSSNPA